MSLPPGLISLLLKVLAGIVMALLFWGNVARTQLAVLLGLVVLVQALGLWNDWRRPRPGEPRWLRKERGAAIDTWWAGREDRFDEEGDEPPAAGFENPTEADLARILARPEWREDFARRHARRADADIVLEALSLVAVPATGFLLGLMLSSPVVAWSGSDRGPAAFGLAAAFALHFAINLIPAQRAAWRVRARGALLVAVFAPALVIAKERHPYLLAVGKESRRLLAERVWSLELGIEAGRHASALVAYAEDLEEARRWADAATVYQRAIELDAFNSDAQEGMGRAQEALGDVAAAAAARSAAKRLADAAWDSTATPDADVEAGAPPGRLPAFDWRPTSTLKICLLPAGEVPDALLDEAGRRLAAELQVPVFRWAGPHLALPEPGRRAALLGGSQWSPVSLMDAFVGRMREEEAKGRQARGAWQFLVVTNADLYLPDSNFVFAVHFPVHGVVSFARLGENGDRRRVERLSKQLVASAIKCFGVKQASRPDCVTAYVDSLDELDRKPIKPRPETRAEYRRRVELWEADTSRDPERPR